MTYAEYMEQHDTENFSWCKPYTNDDETYYLIMHDGLPLVIKTPTIEAWRYDGTLTGDVLKQVAKEINKDYSEKRGYSNTYMILEAMHEIGCHYCPFKEDCEPMGGEIDETDYM